MQGLVVAVYMYCHCLCCAELQHATALYVLFIKVCASCGPMHISAPFANTTRMSCGVSMSGVSMLPAYSGCIVCSRVLEQACGRPGQPLTPSATSRTHCKSRRYNMMMSE